MHVERVACEQGHYVPRSAHAPRGPFPPELMSQPGRSMDERGRPGTEDRFPIGATAQNEYLGVVLYRCRNCEAVVRDDEIELHTCD